MTITRVREPERTDTASTSDRGAPWIELVVVGACIAFVLWQVRPGLVFANTTPTGIDLGGHVWGPDALRAHLFRLTGWTDDFFAGVPAYRFYMPIPALAVLATDLVLPYGVALKLIVVASPVLLPVSVWLLARMTHLRRPMPALMAVASLGFLFDDSFWRYGGNIRSQLAGEFSYGLGLLFVPIVVALVDVVVRTGRWRAATALVCGVTALCHPVVAVMLVGATSVLVAAEVWAARDLRAVIVRRVAPVAVVAALLTAFWTLPFFWYRNELNNIEQTRDTRWLDLFAPLPIWAEILVLLACAFGVRWVWRTRQPIGVALVGMGALAAVLVLALPDGTFANGRPLAFWHLSRWLLAAIGVADVAPLVAARRPRFEQVVPLLALVAVVVPIGAITGTLPFSHTRLEQTAKGEVERSRWLAFPEAERSVIPLWVKENLGGYERNPRADDYFSIIGALVDVASKHGCGRVEFENDPRNRFGSGYEWDLIAYWTGGCLRTTGGLPSDVSRTAPFTDVAISAASHEPRPPQPDVPLLQMDVSEATNLFYELGVRYYVAWSDDARDEARSAPGLDYLGTAAGWDIHQVVRTTLVEGLAPQGIQRIDHLSVKQWRQVALAFFIGGGARRPVLGDVPELRSTGRPVRVSNVRVTDGRIRFTVAEPGVPVLIRTTYFPWWRASGARGPWRASPNFMVVIPTKRDVTLTASPRTPDNAGLALTWIGIAGLFVLAAFDWRRRTALAATES